MRDTQVIQSDNGPLRFKQLAPGRKFGNGNSTMWGLTEDGRIMEFAWSNDLQGYGWYEVPSREIASPERFGRD